MIKRSPNKITLISILFFFLISSCAKDGFFKPGDARKNPPDPRERVKKNLEEGKGFRLNDVMKPKGGVFDFANSNELWRASLDAIDFMPLVSANYSGGIIITDWYSNDPNSSESLKITIRFLTNEIRSDAIAIKIYNKRCSNNLLNCEIFQTDGVLVAELKRKILKNATILKEENEKGEKEKK